MKNCKVENNETAWVLAKLMLKDEIVKDDEVSKIAGYSVYRSTTEYYNYICDLGNRLEVNFSDAPSVDIWINTEVDLKEQIKHLEHEIEVLNALKR